MPKLGKDHVSVIKQAARERAKTQSIQFQKDQIKDHASCLPKGALKALMTLSFERGKKLQLISLGEHQDYQTLMRVLGVDFDQDPRFKEQLAYFLVPDSKRYGRMQSALIWAGRYVQVGLETNAQVLAHFKNLRQAVTQCNWQGKGRISSQQINQMVKDYSSLLKQEATKRQTTYEAIDDYNQIALQHYQLSSQCSQMAWLVMSLHLGVGFANDPLYPELSPILAQETKDQDKIIQLLDVLIQRSQCYADKDKEAI